MQVYIRMNLQENIQNIIYMQENIQNIFDPKYY